MDMELFICEGASLEEPKFDFSKICEFGYRDEQDESRAATDCSKVVSGLLCDEPPWLGIADGEQCLSLELLLPFSDTVTWRCRLDEILLNEAADWEVEDRAKVAEELRDLAQRIEARSSGTAFDTAWVTD